MKSYRLWSIVMKKILVRVKCFTNVKVTLIAYNKSFLDPGEGNIFLKYSKYR